ncbi:MAG: hypothetical protein IPM54_11515 [Polyangiaceae bacterium]|nr:hypothetical protein [Polyangiaceae bacterium]
MTAAQIHGIKTRPSAAAEAVRTIAADLKSRNLENTSGGIPFYTPVSYSASNIEDHAAMCLAVLETLAQTKPFDPFLTRCLAEHLNQDDHIKIDDAVQVLRDVALDGLFEHLDEHLDSRNILLILLQKYKQRSEWFRRDRLRRVAGDGLEGKLGERALAADLYEYLLDQSVEFFVEPASGAGEADIVLREPNGKYIVVDAKYIKAEDAPSEVKRKLASGFHQVARYCDDYNEPAGYLVAYSESRRRLAVELAESDGWRLLPAGGKLIYFVEIGIADSPSASKLGRADEIVVSAEELIARHSHNED